MVKTVFYLEPYKAEIYYYRHIGVKKQYVKLPNLK